VQLSTSRTPSGNGREIPAEVADPVATVQIYSIRFAVAFAISCSAPAAERKSYDLVTVVKIVGINWFNRMETGVKRFGTDTGNKTALVGPATADSSKQIQIVEDLIAKKVNGLVVIPFQPQAMEPMLKKAQDHKIAVVTHEASDIKNADYDLEAFDNNHSNSPQGLCLSLWKPVRSRNLT
jgi:ABC-type sugar transport system substrate-binding protein